MNPLLTLNLPVPLVAFLTVLTAALGVPLPALPIMVLIGSMAAMAGGAPGVLAASLAAAVVGGLIGDTLWFLAGRRFGARVLSLLCRISLSRDSCVRQTGNVLSRYGVRLVLFARFVPGLSVVAVPMTGAAGVAYSRFLWHDVIGVGAWVAAGLALGYAFSDVVAGLLNGIASLGLEMLGAVAILALIAYIGVRLARRRSQQRELALPRATVAELRELIDGGSAHRLIDVRSVDQRSLDPYEIPGARVAAMDASDAELLALAERSGDRDFPLFVYCACPNEISAARLAQRYVDLGFKNARPLLGGLDAWREAGHPVAGVVLPTPKPARPDVAVEAAG